MNPPLAGDQAVLIIPSGQDPSREVVHGWVAEALASVPPLPRSRVTVVVDELVSNAREHGSLPCVLRLSLDHTRHHLLVFVDDAAPDDDGMWPVGAGLALVDALSLDWGMETLANGKTMWAEVRLGLRIDGIDVPQLP